MREALRLIWGSAVAVQTRSRDGLITVASDWAMWRKMIGYVLSRPCPACEGEGILYWRVDEWHAGPCQRCKGEGRVVMPYPNRNAVR